jgi:choline dehydrogenase-like flavoprotein
MLHVSDFLYVRFNQLRGRGPLNGQLHHGLSINDFYAIEGLKLGNIHAHAIDYAELIASDLKPDEADGTAIFATIVEDFPYPCNRVLPKHGTVAEVCWEYTYPDELRQRSEQLVQAFCDTLTPTCSPSVRQPRGLPNATHMCGTCRFGDDPSTSVLDRQNRLHDLDNSYVVDGSFFPSSGGINPSLTIVANSLRVAASIAC